jgi:hypothetical protein
MSETLPFSMYPSEDPCAFEEFNKIVTSYAAITNKECHMDLKDLTLEEQLRYLDQLTALWQEFTR